GLTHPAFHVASAQIHHQCRAALRRVAQDWRNGFDLFNIGELAKRQHAGFADTNRQCTDCLEILPIRFVKPHNNVEPAIPFNHRSDGLSAERSSAWLAYVAATKTVFGYHGA